MAAPACLAVTRRRPVPSPGGHGPESTRGGGPDRRADVPVAAAVAPPRALRGDDRNQVGVVRGASRAVVHGPAGSCGTSSGRGTGRRGNGDWGTDGRGNGDW